MKQKILIVGGGTAGWMAANLLAKQVCKVTGDSAYEVCLLESPQIGIVGVGEGSTPQLKRFFDVLQIDESQWMPQCNATYKTGIRFSGWSTQHGFSEYFHPFPADTDSHTAHAFVYHCYLRRHGIDVAAHPSAFFLPAYLAQQGLGPKPDENFPFPVSYGYHFDAHLMGEFLQQHAIDLGARYVQGTVNHVALNEQGDIDHILTADGAKYGADFFIDATGFASVLLQKALGVPFESFNDNLFNDAAVVLPTPVDARPNSHTTSTAMKHGWAWDIPLTNRTGNGYVYSSQFCSPDAAEHELREKLGLLNSDVPARHLSMQVGQVTQHWAGNCLGVGLSQGFIEPLEATALHLVQETLELFIENLGQGRTDANARQRFNSNIHDRFNGIRDYIVCHYKLNSRTDTQYWRANSNNPVLSDSLASLLDSWYRGDDLAVEIDRQGIAQYYPVISWHCLFSGYGVYPKYASLDQHDPRARRFPMADIQDFNRRCAMNFQPHSAQLQALKVLN